MFHTILVPLDGSHAAEAALPLAQSIANHSGATLRLVRVLPDLADRFFWAPLPGTETDLDLRQHYIDKAHDYLRTVADRLEAGGVSSVCCDVVVEEETISESIRRDAVRTGADLIVMINQGRGVLGRFWYGSIADELVRSTRVPVLLVPSKPADERNHETNLRHILVGLDGAPEAEEILPAALEMARAMGADLTLIRVVHSAPQATAGHASGEPNALHYLEAVAERLRSEGASVQTRILVASQTAHALLHEADADDDLLALETSGRHGLSRLLHPTVVDAVLHDSVHPVLVLRPSVRSRVAV